MVVSTGVTDKARAKMLVEQEIDRLTKERSQFFLFRDYEIFGGPVWDYYQSRIKSHGNRLKTLRKKQAGLYGVFGRS